MSIRVIVLALSLSSVGISSVSASSLRPIEFEKRAPQINGAPLAEAKLVPAENRARLVKQAPTLRLNAEAAEDSDINLVTINQFQYRSSRNADEGVPVQRAGAQRSRGSKH